MSRDDQVRIPARSRRCLRRVAHPAALVRVLGFARDRGGIETALPDLAIGSALTLAELVGAAWFFTRVYRHAVRTGLFARYSAESVS
jgi:hypothetical protein